MNTSGLTLLIPAKPDRERGAVADSFKLHGGKLGLIDRFWQPPDYEASTVRVYGPDTFCLVLQQKIGFELVSPDDELIFQVPATFIQRELVRRTLGEINGNLFPMFVKPVVPKQFRAAVYLSGAALFEECNRLGPETALIAAEPVTFVAEVRTFVFEKRVLDAALYEGRADLAEAVETVVALIRSMDLPRALVVDMGLIVGRGWAVIEFNAAWGAGLNGCSAQKVLPAIVAASSPQVRR